MVDGAALHRYFTLIFYEVGNTGVMSVTAFIPSGFQWKKWDNIRKVIYH